MKYLDLPYPHGFLVWKCTQTHIASDKPLDGDKFLIVTGKNSFGQVQLGKPSVMTVEMFDQKNDEHYVRPFERRLWWPDAEILYSYPIVSRKLHKKSKFFIDGKEVDYSPRGKELQLILKAKELPSKIVLDDRAVCAGISGFSLSDIAKESPTLRKLLRAFYEVEELDGLEGGLSLPIYELALTRNPNMVVEKV